jgi:type IV secretory pathway VirB3-like protein
MAERILKAVAYPQTMFWVPLPLAAANFGIFMLLMIFGWGFFRLNPLGVVIMMLIVHVLIAAKAQQEPHLANLIQARGKIAGRTKNLIPAKGKKYIP